MGISSVILVFLIFASARKKFRCELCPPVLDKSWELSEINNANERNSAKTTKLRTKVIFLFFTLHKKSSKVAVTAG